ncbi:MAG: hypothetical protein WBA74_06935 [Cyclobacteriaceae bacterium]
MNIKVSLASKALTKNKDCMVTPEWLLENEKDELLTRLICHECDHESVMQNGEPSCYGECIDNVVEQGYEIEYDNDVQNGNMTNKQINKIIKNSIDNAGENSLKALTDIVIEFKHIG